jgi:hypothetical protein
MRGAIERSPGARHAVAMDADVVFLAGLDRGIEPVLLLVELGAQEIRHDQPQPADAPLALHGDGDLVEAVDHRLDAIGRRQWGNYKGGFLLRLSPPCFQ